MRWINASEYTINFKMDLGNGRERITLEPSETIEIPSNPVYMDAVRMEAPQLQPYEPKISDEPQLEIVEIEHKTVPKKRGRKTKPKAN